MNYKKLKWINVAFHSIEVPLGVYCGIMLATNQVLLFTVGMVVLAIASGSGSYLYYTTMERIPKE
jgi:hypothetical protein